MTKKKIAVIGMGPSGLAVVKELKAAGCFDVVGFDRQSAVGGRWACCPGSKTGVYQELTLNISRRGMEFSDIPWDAANIPNINDGVERQAYAGQFAHSTEARNYLQAYADRFDLMPSVRLKTEVVKIEKGEGEGSSSWTIVTRPVTGKNRKETVHSFDGLVCCSGLFAAPKNPLKDATVRNFDGDVLHNADVQSVADFDGKRVLVIGSAISGSDLTCSLAEYGKCAGVVNSVRHVPYHMHKLSDANPGRTLDDALGIRLPGYLMRVLPTTVTNEGFRQAVLADWPKQLSKEVLPDGLELPSDIGEADTGLSASYVHQAERGSFAIKPGLKPVQPGGKTIAFDDGTEQEFDAVVCATGFTIDLSYLPQSVQDKILHTNRFNGSRTPKLYKFTLVPGVDTLAFAGYFHNAGGHFPMAEMQARYIAAVWSGAVPRPAENVLEAGVRSYEVLRDVSKFNQFDPYVLVMDGLGEELGVAPSFWRALLSPRKLLFSPIHSCYYRTNPTVDGAETAKECTERFEEYLANPSKGEL